MFRKCKLCNKQFEVADNDRHISKIRKIFCCRYHKDRWNHKYNPKVILAKRKAQRKWYENNREKIRLYFKSYYIPHPKTLLTSEEKRQRIRLWNRNRKYRLRKLNHPITLDLIQKVYEENIKQYKTLTCYLCLKPIEFGQDSLEHKIPLARNGTNLYDNLAVAHNSCNNKKNTKTYEEYMQLTNTH